MPPSFYSLYGLTIQSDIPLHAPPAPTGPADLHIHCGVPRPVPAEPAPGELLCRVDYGAGGAAHTRTEHGYTLRYFNTAEFELSADLTRVTAHTDPGAPANLVPEFLTASVLAFVRLLSGHVVLHASAVARNGKAIGILAQSGGGKSTIAAALCAQGFSPVTDDVLTLDWRGRTPRVRPGPTELRLRAGSIALVAGSGWHAQRQTVDGRTAIKFPSPHAPSAWSESRVKGAAEPAPLAAFLLPILDLFAQTVTLSRMEAHEALAAIIGHLRVAGWKDTPVFQRIFPEQVRLARQVPGYRLTIPWGAQGLQDTAKLLRDLPELIS
jgi:hypothetical protein